MMTIEERIQALAKKHCYNGHDPERCELIADIRKLLSDCGVAQLVEQRPVKATAEGSSPSSTANKE